MLYNVFSGKDASGSFPPEIHAALSLILVGAWSTLKEAHEEEDKMLSLASHLSASESNTNFGLSFDFIT